MLKRWWFWVIVAIVAVIVIAAGVNAVRGPVVKVKVDEVVDVGLEQQVSASGEVQSRADVDVYSPLQGTVKRVYVDNQTQVRQGQQVVLIDPAPFRVAKAAAYAAYKQAQAGDHQVSKSEPTGKEWDAADAAVEAAYAAWWVADKEFKAMEPTIVKNPDGSTTVVPADYSQLKLAVDNSYAAYEQALASRSRLGVQGDTGLDHAAGNANVDQAWLAYQKSVSDLDKTCVKAPIAGTIVLDNFAGTGLEGPARELSKNQAVTPQTPLVRIIDRKRMQFIADIDEADVSLVRKGQKARISLDAYEGRTHWGTVMAVSVLAKTTQSGGSAFAADIIMPSAKDLKVGMNGTADIIIQKEPSALQIPIEAVTERDGKDVVFVIDNDTAKLTEVKLGFSTDTVYEVKDGVSAGQAVAVSGLDELEDGVRVQEE